MGIWRRDASEMDLALFGLSPALIATILAGIAAFAAVLVFLPDGTGALKTRLSAVKDRREALKNAHKIKETTKKKGVNENTLKVMRSTVERFKMQDMIENTELRMKLAQAGFRGARAPIMFLFFQIVMPFLLLIAALVYFSFIFVGNMPLPQKLAIAGVIAVIGSALPKIWVKNITDKRQTKMSRAYPDALDLMVICVEAGMSVERAFQKVAEEISEQSTDLAEELALCTAELSYLGDRTLALENLSKRTGLQAVKALTSALVQAERYGTPVASALRVLSEESRNERMSIAERKAAALPAKLTVPMIVFFLPVLFIVIIGPAVVQVMSQPGGGAFGG